MAHLARQRVLGVAARCVTKQTSLLSTVARAAAPAMSATARPCKPVFTMRPLAARSFGTAAAQTATSTKKPDMFCFQCEQTDKGTGCTTIGVCGKTPEVATLQDLLINCCKGISSWAHIGRQFGVQDPEVDQFTLDALFASMTNVNFDAARMVQYLRSGERLRNNLRTRVEAAAKKAGKPIVLSENSPAYFTLPASDDVATLVKEGEKFGVLDRKANLGADIVGIQEMTVYGLKGLCAYAHHAAVLGQRDPKVFDTIHEILYQLTLPNPQVGDMLGLAMKVGETNLRVMELLDAGSVSTYGHPEPTQVLTTPLPGKAILVSGHDLADLEAVLKATEGKNINVYTHGEMLPAHGYPGLKKYKHLAGHYGGPWQLQKFEFSQFPGAILMTSNCIVEPRKAYKERIFTRSIVGWPGVTHIKDTNYEPLIKAALEAPGFPNKEVKPQYLMTGFARNAVMSVAGKVIDGVKAGAIKHFFLIGGCDGSEGERSYFKDLAVNSPKDTIILTLGCGKFRVNNLNLGNLGDSGIPRVLDMGQCNDAYSAISVASALAKAFNTDVNGLPLSFAVSWFEQKAVAVLLTLLHLGVKKIHLGPNLPGFVTPGMLDIIVKKFDLRRTGDAAGDLKRMLAKQ